MRPIGSILWAVSVPRVAWVGALRKRTKKQVEVGVAAEVDQESKLHSVVDRGASVGSAGSAKDWAATNQSRTSQNTPILVDLHLAE